MQVVPIRRWSMGQVALYLLYAQTSNHFLVETQLSKKTKNKKKYARFHVLRYRIAPLGRNFSKIVFYYCQNKFQSNIGLLVGMFKDCEHYCQNTRMYSHYYFFLKCNNLFCALILLENKQKNNDKFCRHIFNLKHGVRVAKSLYLWR